MGNRFGDPKQGVFYNLKWCSGKNLLSVYCLTLLQYTIEHGADGLSRAFTAACSCQAGNGKNNISLHDPTELYGHFPRNFF